MKAGWQVKSLGEILVRTETVDPTRSPNEEFVYIDVSSVSNETLSIQEVQRLKGADAPSRARKQVRANDVLFATIRPTLRRIAIVPSDLDGEVCSTGYFVLRLMPEVDPRFVYYFLQTAAFMSAMESLQKGASYPAVTDGDVRSQSLAFPLLSEQQRIVDILDEAFEGIATVKANAEKNLENTKDLFLGYLDYEISSQRAGWKEFLLKDVAKDFGRGKSKHRPRNDPALYGGPYPFIQTGDVRNSDHLITEYTQTYSDRGLAQSKLWPEGTLCITIAANIAETGVLSFDACFPDSVIGFVPDPTKANVKFVEYLLQNYKSVLQAQGKGSAQDNINLGTFEGQRFPFPDVETQSGLVDRFDRLREDAARLEGVYASKLLALDDLKQSLLHHAFSGQL